MKTLDELFAEHNMLVGSALTKELQKVCVEYIESILKDSVDIATLPEEIKIQANAFQQTHWTCAPNVAWLEGFGFCLAGKVHVERAASEKNVEYETLSNAVRDLISCVEDCSKNELARARQVARVIEHLKPINAKVEGDWVVRDKEPL